MQGDIKQAADLLLFMVYIVDALSTIVDCR